MYTVGWPLPTLQIEQIEEVGSGSHAWEAIYHPYKCISATWISFDILFSYWRWRIWSCSEEWVTNIMDRLIDQFMGWYDILLSNRCLVFPIFAILIKSFFSLMFFYLDSSTTCERYNYREYLLPQLHWDFSHYYQNYNDYPSLDVEELIFQTTSSMRSLKECQR